MRGFLDQWGPLTSSEFRWMQAPWSQTQWNLHPVEIPLELDTAPIKPELGKSWADAPQLPGGRSFWDFQFALPLILLREIIDCDSALTGEERISECVNLASDVPSDSLLFAFCWQAGNLVLEGHHLRQCAHVLCATWRLMSPRQIYCDDRCERNAQKWRARAKAKEQSA